MQLLWIVVVVGDSLTWIQIDSLESTENTYRTVANELKCYALQLRGTSNTQWRKCRLHERQRSILWLRSVYEYEREEL